MGLLPPTIVSLSLEQLIATFSLLNRPPFSFSSNLCQKACLVHSVG